MSPAVLTESDTRRAQQLWAEYASNNDLSDRRGLAAGIDPATGRVWFGDSALDIVSQMDAAGEFTPLYFVRVGDAAYLRKGGRR